MTRNEAIQYLQDHTAMSYAQTEKEIDRYITWPGQACAYKMGELEIMRMRNYAEEQLGMIIWLFSLVLSRQTTVIQTV